MRLPGGHGYLRFVAGVGISILWAMLLGGCAAVHPRNAPPPVELGVQVLDVGVSHVADLRVSMLTFDLSNGGLVVERVPVWGVTTSTMSNDPVEVRLSGEMAGVSNLLRSVTLHELGHVLNLDHDCSDPLMCPSLDVATPLIDAPGEAMVTQAIARNAGRHYRLAIKADTPTEYVEAVRWAAARWNVLLGRRVFSLVLSRGAVIPNEGNPVPQEPGCNDGG
jgi:hypothetical protein